MPGHDDPAPDQDTSQGTLAVAQNRSTVFQVVWQVQQGCRSYCYGTSQTQSAVQWSSTTQTAVANGDGASGSSPSAAQAANESLTIQFAWQTQIGCVAFCYETSQVQTASQWAQTSQTAVAEADIEAWAQNLSETLQYVWQLQEGCTTECHGVSQRQSSAQGQSTTQSAKATGRGEGGGTTLALGPDGVIVLPGWLVALAENLGASIQTIYQYQEADCLERCDGGAQVQEAVQRAVVEQVATAIALAAPPAPPSEPPAGGSPPASQAPAPAAPARAAAARAVPAEVTVTVPAAPRRGRLQSGDLRPPPAGRHPGEADRRPVDGADLPHPGERRPDGFVRNARATGSGGSSAGPPRAHRQRQFTRFP